MRTRKSPRKLSHRALTARSLRTQKHRHRLRHLLQPRIGRLSGHPNTTRTTSSTPPPRKRPGSTPSSPKPRTPVTIPTTSFYGSSPGPASGSANSKKRKFTDDDGATEKSVEDWARTPLSPGMTFSSSPTRKRHSGSKGGRPTLNGTPFSRIKGANNLHQRRDPPMQYGGKKKKRLIM